MSRIRANQFTNKAGTGAPTFPNGVQVTGVATATSFSGALTGNATGLSGTPNITVGNIIASSATISGNVSVAGTVTYEDVTNVDSVGLITARTGVRINAGGLVVVGVTTVAAGSVSSPSISPTGDSDTGIFFPSADTIAFGEGGAEAARIDSSGRFGLGTTSPSDLLHLYQNAADNVIAKLENAQGTSGNLLQFVHGSAGVNNAYIGHGGDATGNLLILNAANTATTFLTNSTERARIDSSGRLLLGTSSAISGGLIDQTTGTQNNGPRLQIAGADWSHSSVILASYQNHNLVFPQVSFNKSESGTLGTIGSALASGSALGGITFSGSDGAKFVTAASIAGFADGTCGVNDMPGRLVFSTTADSAFSPTEAMRINNQRELLIGTTTRTANGGVLQVSNGITFPATQSACSDANTLDDYEEGTWTPTLVSSGATFTMDGLATGGTYVKIGRTVFLRCVVCASSITGTLTNAVFISGVPYAPTGFSHATYIPGNVLINAPLPGVRGSLINSAGSAGAYFNPYFTTQITINLIASNLSANGTAILEMTYIA